MRVTDSRVGRHGLLVVAAIAATAILAGCSEETTAPDLATEPGVFVANVKEGVVYLSLGDTAREVAVTDPAASADWDLALTGLQVRLNGGAHAASNVAGYCICANENLSGEELQALTAEGELAAFAAVTSASVPASGVFEEDALVPAVSGWYTGEAGSGAAVNPAASWILRKGTSSPLFGKFRITSIAGAATAGPAGVTIEHTTQTTQGEPFPATATTAIDLTSGPVYFSMTDGVVTSSDEWDLLIDGWVIRINGGVSGSGGLSAVPAEGVPFESIDAAFAASVPNVAYETDAYGGVFASHPWYRYNLTGTDHQVWPTYDIYLIRRGDEVFKIQIIGYYDAAGTSGTVTLRYARVDD